LLIGLRITVAGARGLHVGVPALRAVLERHGATGTFYFNLGPARARWWLPGQALCARAAETMRAVRAAGHELGLLGWDPLRWVRHVDDDEPGWVEQALRRACAAFEQIAGEAPRTHAAPGWRTSRRALRLTQRCGFDYASDVLGVGAFMPVCAAELVLCPQLPTTLPPPADAPDERLLSPARAEPGHVCAVAADDDREVRALPALLEAWRSAGHRVTTLRALFEAIELRELPRCAVRTEPAVSGRGATATVQAERFLA
jgi:peptidoglycan/xylan/chitin deacetylase (PgdA/CDA1 family)